jgi:hypothetical protein
MLNDGETQMVGVFAEALFDKLAGGLVKSHAVLKLTDVAYQKEIDQASGKHYAVITNFEARGCATGSKPSTTNPEP